MLELTARNSNDKSIVLVVKEQPGLDEDIQKRVFVVASYLLVSNENVIFSMTNLAHAKTNSLLYYPEYTLDLGKPLGDFEIASDQSYASRAFEKGLVLVNPHEDRTVTYPLDGDYLKVIPSGSGLVPDDGNWHGELDYQLVSGALELPPISGVILITP